MGASHLQHLLPLNSKSMVLENKGMPKTSSNSNGALWSKVLIAQSMRRRRERNQRIIKKINGGHGSSTTRILMKRRALLEGSRRPINGVDRKVKTLKKLVPNGESVGLDGLFRETADYIMSLEMKVKVMQAMVNMLSDCNMI